MTTTVPALDELTTQVRAALSPLLGDALAAVADDADLARALGDRYDSLTALECVSRVEAAFGVEVDFVAHDVRHTFATVGRIAAFVRDLIEDRTALEATS
ncbi:phosphopantetheine-binding protein [Streptomyces sp. NPDC048361]|uniref:phosphopantetheine-binding protein n=1 Tax=Streptomyces sp. NPDC048361 TaxID=3154720 RepID=UPI00341F0F41